MLSQVCVIPSVHRGMCLPLGPAGVCFWARGLHPLGTYPLDTTINKQTVRIQLECPLVNQSSQDF